jgi:uncharacterized repeat protein (TIGR01451 family)
VGQEVTCVYNDPAVNPGGRLPNLTLNVNVTSPLDNYFNQAEVSTPGDSNLRNNRVQDPTIVVGSGEPNLRLVKRITNITRGGVPLAGVNFSSFVDDPADENDNARGWSQLSPVGVYKLEPDNSIESNDEVDYTVYFLSDGSSPVNNINFCDLIPLGTTFFPSSIQAFMGTVPIAGNFFSPLAPLPSGNACANQTNPDGVVIVNLGNISNVEGSNFGFIRFRVRIN